jgi:4'-phosphopantetheinyl transferase
VDIYWLEQSEADLPAPSDWLNPSEAARLLRMGLARRRADWRLGRWTAKRALALYWNLPGDSQTLQRMEIRSQASGAPVVFYAGQPVAVTISLSHRTGIAACAVTRSGAALGCDLEIAEPRSDAFVADYFAAEEEELVARTSAAERPRVVALLWSAKESTLKALRAGLRLDTRCVTVSPENLASSRALNSWQLLNVRYAGGATFHGWWQCEGNLLRTLVAAPAPAMPISLARRGNLFERLPPEDRPGGLSHITGSHAVAAAG